MLSIFRYDNKNIIQFTNSSIDCINRINITRN